MLGGRGSCQSKKRINRSSYESDTSDATQNLRKEKDLETPVEETVKSEQGRFSWVYKFIDRKASTFSEEISMEQNRTPDDEKVHATIPQDEAKFAWLHRWMNRTTSTSSDESLTRGSSTPDSKKAHMATPRDEAELTALVPLPESLEELVELLDSDDKAISEGKERANEESMEILEMKVRVQRRAKLMENDPKWDAKWKLEEKTMQRRNLGQRTKEGEDQWLMHLQQREAAREARERKKRLKKEERRRSRLRIRRQIRATERTIAVIFASKSQTIEAQLAQLDMPDCSSKERRKSNSRNGSPPKKPRTPEPDAESEHLYDNQS